MGLIELKTLSALKSDLESDIVKLNNAIRNESILLAKNDQLIKILKDDQSVYHDSLLSKFGSMESYNLFVPKKLAYESLKSSGLEIISNDSLLMELTLLYDEHYSSNDILTDTKKELFSNSFSVITKHFETGNKTFTKKPNDFEALKQDQEFMNFFTYSTELRRFILENWYKKNLLPKTITLKEKIEQEIDAKTN
ncbi:MAG: hypothetical protein Sapg2KO_25060 [Saprospiraceae bacterium]